MLCYTDRGEVRMVYSFFEAHEQLATLLEKAWKDGQVKVRNRDGHIFVISPVQSQKTSPFDVRSIKLPITRDDIFEAIQESRDRF